MRNAFVAQLESAMREDPRIVLLTGDIGFGIFDLIRKEFPNRFFNAGVAEQNMVALASGLALSGMRPWVYSMPSFLVLRAAEFIRNDICTPGLPVCLIGNGAGFAYGPMGSSHHALEDLSLLKSLPGLQIFMPAHAEDLQSIVKNIRGHEGPTYLRLHHTLSASFAVPPTELPPRARAHIVAFGTAARWVPSELGRSAPLTVLRDYPLNSERLRDLALALQSPDSATPTRILFVEEHSVRGGLSESLAHELQTLMPVALRYRIAGLRTVSEAQSASADHLTQIGGLGAENLERLWSEVLA